MKAPKTELPHMRHLTPGEWASHHKFISSKLALTKAHLIERAKSTRGLTLEEKINLDEINFLMASGFDIHEEPIFVGQFDPVTRQKKSRANEDTYKSLSKAELVTKLAAVEVELEELRNSLNMEAKRFEFLLKYFDEHRQERIKATKARQVGKKTSPTSIHVRQMEAAREIIKKIKDSKGPGTNANGSKVPSSFEPTDFKLFCKKMRAACKPPPSNTTLRNYFLKMTGLSTTK
jgi:hypothetical protein